MDNSAQLSPREFMRARHPEQFTDSVPTEVALLDRALLEYHLSTLTNRGQENDFETFARKLAEREICPNLLPHTGPSGGGDSKVDSETYPVSDQLAVGWYSGIGVEAATERWAFAFSAKQDWQAKVRSDVAKIAATDRNYHKAFFVSSQYIPDKQRAAFEDELTKKFDLDVRILDRNWLLDRVFTNHRELLAIEHLRIAVSVRPETTIGPLDAQRDRDLNDLDARIGTGLAEGKEGFQLVQDCIQAALLSRALDRPRTETDGRFARADRVAGKFGFPQQRVECLYQRAWTAFWWHEDYSQFADLYGEVEEYVSGTTNPHDLGRLANLWFLLKSAVVKGRLDSSKVSLPTRTDSLRHQLAALSKEPNAPSASLHAETLLLKMELALQLGSGESIDPLMSEFKDVVIRSEGLVGFPFQPLADFVVEMGDILQHVAGYDELFETVVNAAALRESEITTAELLALRGRQQLSAGKPYEAISTLGRALGRLYKHESRDAEVRALYGCALAYERIGLLWAARGTMLVSAWLAERAFSERGKITRQQAACSNRLKWIELQLGRPAQALSWHHHEGIIRQVLVEKGYAEEGFAEGDLQFNMAFGALLLRSDSWELKWISRLPGFLSRNGLEIAADCLVFVLGYEDKLRAAVEGGDADSADPEPVMRELDQQVGSDLPRAPSFYEGRKVTLESHILGCHVTLTSQNTSPCVEFAESLLAALESFVSTGAITRMMAREPALEVEVVESVFVTDLFDWKVDFKSGRPFVIIQCRPLSGSDVGVDVQRRAKEKLVELIASVIAHVVMIDNADDTLRQMVGHERAFERAIDFAGTRISAKSILGPDTKDRLSMWSESSDADYPPLRAVPWQSTQSGAATRETSFKGFGAGDIPPELLDRAATKHSEIQTLSIIREKLWEEAHWHAVAFMGLPDDSEPPLLVPVFKSARLAKAVIDGLREDIGTDDRDDLLRVSIIRGINKKHPFRYRVLLGTNINQKSLRGAKFFAVVSRTITMTPKSDVNVERFLEAFAKIGAFFITTAADENGSMDDLQVFYESSILKRNIHVKWARDVARHDPDSAAIHIDDDPILLPDQEEAPAVELLNWKRKSAKPTDGHS
jgi:hypothetical protein